MRKLGFLVMLLTVMLVSSVGCQPLEERVRDIVAEEVTRQLADADTVVVSELYIKGEDGQVVAFLRSGADDSGALSLYNDDEECIVHLGADADTNGILSLYNEDGECVAYLGASEDADGILYLFNRDGDVVALIGASSSGDGCLDIYDRDGYTTFAAPEE